LEVSLALLVQKYLLTGMKVQILTPEELLQGERRGGPLPYSLKHLRRLQHLDVSLFY
jgi:hypothetical protein